MTVVVAVLVVAGAALALVAAIALVKFPDTFSRMHAATKPATLGLLLVVLAACLRVRRLEEVTTLLLVGAFQLLTAPLAAHLLARGAHRRGEPLRPDTRRDELDEARRSE